MTSKHKFYILTGDPGVGKTTLVKKLTSLMKEKGVKTSGFYTEEVRKSGVREGFDVVSLEGQRGRLARDKSTLSIPVKCMVGKYGVLLQEFESIALPCLIMPDNPQQHLLVVDELGKMEFYSEPFKNKIRHLFGQSSNYTVLATIPLRRSDSLIETIRNHSQSRVWVVTRENRNTIHEDILREMNKVYND